MGTKTLIVAPLIVILGLTFAAAEPAWKKIAKKLRPNSTETVTVRELPEVADENPGIDVAAADKLSPVTDGRLLSIEEDEEPAPGTSRFNLGKEYEEKGTISNLFDNPEVLRMLGDDPRFVYAANDRPDPMVFPPIRNAAIYTELKTEADDLVEAGKLAEAVGLLGKILSLNDRRFIRDTQLMMAELNAKLGLATQADVEVVLVDLPGWVRDNTRGVMYDAVRPLCLVGDYLLEIGDVVPDFPGVRIAGITQQRVTYQVSDQTFDIDVDGFDQ